MLVTKKGKSVGSTETLEDSILPKIIGDKRATTNVQNGLVFFFLFSFILLRLVARAIRNTIDSRESIRANHAQLKPLFL